MNEKIFTFWFPRKYLLKESEREHTKFIIGIAYTIIVVNICYFFFNLQQGIPIGPALGGILGNVILLLLVRTSRSYLVPANVLLLFTAGYILSLVYLFRSFPFTILLWLPGYAIMSVYLVGKVGGGLWSIILGFSVTYVVIWHGLSKGAAYQINSAQINPVTAISVALTMTFSYYSSVLFMNYISKLSKKLDQQNRELTAKNKIVSENIEVKKTLISVICHDIANPLSVVLGFAEAAQNNNDIKKLKSFHVRIYRAALMLKDIVDDVRNLHALDSGKMEVSLAATDLLEVFKNLELVFSERLKKKGISLVFEDIQGKNLWVEAEQKSLTYSVLSNLISNAIKFSEAGETITLSVSEENGQIFLAIKDTGIGMPETLVADLFKHDKKTTRIGTSGETGTGFGMPITKAYMEQYGGDIAVSTREKSAGEIDHGTTFHLTFNKAKNQP